MPKGRGTSVDSDLADRIEQLRNEIIAAVADVSSTLESGEEATHLAMGETVKAIVARYNELLAGDDRDRVQIALDRRITDLRRAAAQLMQRVSGSKTELATDSGLPFLLQRKPGKSIVPERAPPTTKQSVGGEVDAWCGKCKEMRTHNIVAMVGGEAKQVVCQTCSSRHNFRTDPPARARTASGAVPTVVGTAAVRAADKEQHVAPGAEARAAKRADGRRRAAHVRPQEPLQVGRDHRPPRIRPRQGGERPPHEPAGPLPGRPPPPRPGLGVTLALKFTSDFGYLQTELTRTAAKSRGQFGRQLCVIRLLFGVESDPDRSVV